MAALSRLRIDGGGGGSDATAAASSSSSSSSTSVPEPARAFSESSLESAAAVFAVVVVFVGLASPLAVASGSSLPAGLLRVEFRLLSTSRYSSCLLHGNHHVHRRPHLILKHKTRPRTTRRHNKAMKNPTKMVIFCGRCARSRRVCKCNAPSRGSRGRLLAIRSSRNPSLSSSSTSS